MDTLVRALRVFEASSAIPDGDGDDLQPTDHPLVEVIMSLAFDLLVTTSGEFNFSAIDTLWRDHRYFVSPRRTTLQEPPMACLHTKKGLIVFG